uniref:Uncharacterized protein n=1 Tax=Tetradesmus obliquus TaxID=3088 RepID=A0A383WB69_TETOB|eukprot:jgi/Sobl393_1/6657/SZX74452.1
MDALAATRRVVLLLCIGSITTQLVAAADCPVQYSPKANDPPLLYGGYYSACQGAACQPRDSVWGKSCKLDPDAYSAWGVCEHWQRPQPFAAAQQLSAGGIQALSPCDLFAALGNRTLWVIGDSHAKVLYYSLRCFMMDFWDHSQGECAASSDAALQKQLELSSAQGHPYNNPPRCLHLSASGARICVVHNPIGTYLVSNDSQASGTLQLLHDHFAAPDDVVYVGFGHWHSNNCEGIHPSYAAALEAFGAYAESVRATLPNVVFSVAPHEHTKCAGKSFDFNTPTCLPAEQGEYNTSIGLETAAMAHDILSKYGIQIIDNYNISVALYNSHITAAQSIAGIIDCLHYCRPSLGEIELWKLYTIMAAQQPVAAKGGVAATNTYTCVPVDPLLYYPHGPVNASGSSSSAGAAVMGEGEVMPLWEQDAWGYPYPANR